MKRKSTSQSAPARRSPWLAIIFKRRRLGEGGFFNFRVLLASVLALAAIFMALLGVGAFSNASAQANATQEPKAQQFGETTVIHAWHSDLSRPLREQPLAWPPAETEHEANLNPQIPHQHLDGPDPVIQSSFWQRMINVPSIPAPTFQWAGIPFPGVSCNCAPPDTDGEVGKTQYVQMVNEGLQVFDKLTGTSILGPIAISSVWSGFGGACQNGGSGDPIVIYDQLADRWIISQFAVPSGASVPQDECIAISQTGDATGAWYRYGFHLTGNFLDYPKLGVWPDGYYMAANVFNSSGTSFLGPQPFVFDRVKMLVGDATATSQTRGIIGGSSEETFLPADLDGIIPPPAGDPNHFVAWPQGSPLIYKVWAYHADFTTPANSTFTLEASVGAASFTALCSTTRNCVPQASTSTRLDAIGDRLMFRNAYRRFADGHDSMLNNYTVSANSVAGIRWFELRRTQPGNWGIFQQSTYQPDTTWRWMGSIGSDNQGNIALGFSASSSSISPQIRYAGRLATDPLNTLSGEQHLFDGTGSQSATSNRWGDYSDLTVDPVDDCTFYYTNEYYQTTSSFNWRTRIGYFKFAECTAPQKGTAHFIVTACTGGAPAANASVSIDGRSYGATLSDGTYDAALTPGSRSYSVTKAGVGTQSGNFTITNGQITNVPVCLGSSPSPTPTATATATSTTTPAPTPTPTSTPTSTPISQCTVPNFIGARLNQAQSIWANAGFTTNVTTVGSMGHQITTQSLPPGYFGSCTTTTITVTTNSPSPTPTATATATAAPSATPTATATATSTPTPTPASGIALTAVGYKSQGRNTVDLTWGGATSDSVDIYRNNAPLTNTANGGAYTDHTGDRGSATYTYQVCEAGTNTCSNEATVTF